MIDLSPPILALLVCAATLCIALGVAGRIDRARPRCGACGADARRSVTADGFRCGCGADLAQRRAVCWRRRRPWLLVVGSCLAIVAALLGWVALNVRSHEPGWCAILPPSLYEVALRRGWDGPSSNSLELVVSRTADPDMRRRYADAIVERLRYEPDRLPVASLRAIGRSIRGGLPAKYGAELIELLSRSISMDISGDPPKLRVAQTDVTLRVTGILVRIDRVRLGEREIPWSLEPLQGTSASDPTRWHRISTEGIAVDLPRDIDLTNDDVRRQLEVDCTMALHRFVRYSPARDPAIANEPDPGRWGFDEIHGTFTVRGAAPATPSPHQSTPRSAFEQFADGRWSGSIGTPQAPVVAALPLLEALVLGLAVGGCIALSILLAARLGSPRSRLTRPLCRGCGFTVGPSESLPPRCTECGRTIGGLDDVRWTAQGGRWRRAITWASALAILVVAVVTMERSAAPRLRSFLKTTIATPEREVRSLVRETIAMRPFSHGPSPSNRLSDGSLETQTTNLRGSPELLRVAANEIVAWAKRSGTFPLSPIDLDAFGRRAILQATLVWAMRATLPDGKPALSSADAATALRCLLRPEDLATVPSVVRVGQRIAADVEPWSRMMIDKFSMTTRCEPERIDAPGVAMVRFSVALSPPVASSDDVLVEFEAERSLAVIPVDAAVVPRELATDAIASGSSMYVVLEDGGASDAVILGGFVGRGIFWNGRWDVLAPDGAVLGSIVTTPQGGEAACVAALPDPWPEELVLRYVPNDRTPDGSPLPRYPNCLLWNEPTRFRFVRGDPDWLMSKDAVRYRLHDATVE